MSLEAFLETAWNDHAERPAEVAERLAAAVPLVAEARDIPPFVRLATHVFGEHLGQWGKGIDLLLSLRALPAFAGDPAAAGAVTRGVATLRYASGDGAAVAALPAEDRVVALAGAAAAFAGRREFGRALSAFAAALAQAGDGLPADSPAHRALAVGGNNIAAALEEVRERDAAQTDGMVSAAEAGLEHWRLAGTWLEEERAHYRLARSLLAAGRPEAAIASATRCIDVGVANDAPAFELFFGHAALALAQHAAALPDAFAASRTRALALAAAIPEAERPWCEAELRELERCSN